VTIKDRSHDKSAFNYYSLSVQFFSYCNSITNPFIMTSPLSQRDGGSLHEHPLLKVVFDRVAVLDS